MNSTSSLVSFAAMALVSGVCTAISRPVEAAPTPKVSAEPTTAADWARVGYREAAKDTPNYEVASTAFERSFKLDTSDVRQLFNASRMLSRVDGRCADTLKLFDKFLVACRGCDYALHARYLMLETHLRCPEVELASLREMKPRVARATVEEDVVGEADIRGDAIVAARDEAIVRAKQAVVEKYGATNIRSTMDDSARSILRGGIEKFEQHVRSQVITQTEGTILGFEVLREERTGQRLRVHARVKVDNALLRRQVLELAKAQAGARNPRLMVFAKETWRDLEGKLGTPSNPSIEPRLQDALRKHEFTVTDRAYSAERAAQELDLFSDQSAAISAALDDNAEYVVSVRADYSRTSAAGMNLTPGTLTLTAKVIEVASARLLASPTVTVASGLGAINERALEQQLATDAVSKLMEELLQAVIQTWTRGLETTYTVKLYDAKLYWEEVEPFRIVLQDVPGVMRVSEVSQAVDRKNGEAMTEWKVEYLRFYDAAFLKRKIMEGIRSYPGLGRVQPQQNRGSTLIFGLGR
jgi:hypothetical protein